MSLIRLLKTVSKAFSWFRKSKPETLGQWGESKAAEFYRSQGAKILGRNVKLGRGELDLVVVQQNRLIFVEVKTRKGSHFGEGWEAVTTSKQKQISRLAVQFLKLYPHPHHQIQFDVVSVQKSDTEFDLKHFPNAFESTI